MMTEFLRDSLPTAVSSSNPLPVLNKPETVLTATGTLGALNAIVSLAITSVYKTVEFYFTGGNLSGITGLYVSYDGGVTYQQLNAKRLDSSSVFNTFSTAGTSLTYKSWRASIPSGATHVAVSCLTYTSGSSDVVLTANSNIYSSCVTADVALAASTNRVGFVQAAGIQYTDTTTALGSSATFTSTARDLTTVTSASTFNSSTTYAKTVSICVVQDVAFTLQLLGSTDNFAAVSEIYRSITATLVGSNYVAEVDAHSCAWRYFQYKIVNSASAAAKTRGVSKFLAN